MASWCENMVLPPRVLIAPRPSSANGQGNILSLRHPKLEEETQYLFSNGRLHEFNWFKERYGSWFLGDYVCEEVANMKFFRLDDSKVLTWLCCKVHNIKEVIPKFGKNYAAQGERELLKDAIQIIRENLKDEPWLPVLCKKLQLDISEINETTKSNDTSFCAESSPIPAPARPSEGNIGNGSAKSSKGRPVKKLKAEVGSKNIKDMFRRVTRSGT